MSSEKDEKIKSAVLVAAANFIQKESSGLSLITATRTEMSKDGKYVSIFFTVFPEDKEEEALDFLRRKRSEFRQYVKDVLRLGRIPTFDFHIDFGEKNRQKIDRIALESK